MAMTEPALSCFAGRAGHHTDRLVRGAPLLAAALPALTKLATRIDTVLDTGGVPVSAIGVCSVALATVPAVARHRPDAVVVWFDAHADLNTPATSMTGFLGGMALAGPLGLWDSGLGSGLAQGRVVLVGSRDLDPPEHDLVDSGRVALVPVADDMAARLRAVIAGRPEASGRFRLGIVLMLLWPAYWTTASLLGLWVRNGAPGWVTLLVLLAFWNGIKFMVFGPRCLRLTLGAAN